jgi:hypothetical protein
MPVLTPEQGAREQIDRMLDQAGWMVQPRDAVNLGASRGVAVGEFPLTTGFADYMLFIDRRPIGVVEAKAVGKTLSGVEGRLVPQDPNDEPASALLERIRAEREAPTREKDRHAEQLPLPGT